MAGFRIGRGRDSRSAQQGQQQRPQQQQPYGQQAPYGGQQQQWQQSGTHGEPEYFGGGQDPYYGGQGPGHGQYADNNAGHTQQFSLGDDPYGHPPAADPYQDGSVNTYRAGATAPPPVGPRLHWKELLSGIVLRPSATFWQMRDYTVWGPALIVTFVYGLLAVFGFDKARSDVLNATISNSIPWILSTGVVIVLSGLILGAVTHTMARQMGGDGAWAPTVGLSMLIMSLTDAPRLVFAMFLGGDSSFVVVLGLATWVAAGALLTSMVSASHDLPWPKALGASAIQLVAMVALLKVGAL